MCTYPEGFRRHQFACRLVILAFGVEPECAQTIATRFDNFPVNNRKRITCGT